MVATVSADNGSVSGSAGIKLSSDSSGVLALQSGANTTAITVDASQNVGIGTSSPSAKLHVSGGQSYVTGASSAGAYSRWYNNAQTTGDFQVGQGWLSVSDNIGVLCNNANAAMILATNATERMRITSGGNVLIGTTATNVWNTTTPGVVIEPNAIQVARSGEVALLVNRITNDGQLVRFSQDGAEEGNISVSGTTVSYNGGHLARYAQTTTAKDESLVKGTVLSNLDAMNVYTDAEGNPVDNEQLNKVKVSDVEGDANVAGVFVNWDYDEAHQVDEINMAMTGDMIIRIAQGVTVQRGDLLMSAGDGTAKAQGDDIVRSKTIAKVTSNHVTCTYEDGSYCVPCVLMAC